MVGSKSRERRTGVATGTFCYDGTFRLTEIGNTTSNGTAIYIYDYTDQVTGVTYTATPGAMQPANENRAAIVILDGHAIGIDAKMAIGGRQKIAYADAAVGGADDLAAGDAAAADEQRSGARPMTSPRLNGPSRRTGRAFAAAGDLRRASGCQAGGVSYGDLDADLTASHDVTLDGS